MKTVTFLAVSVVTGVSLLLQSYLGVVLAADITYTRCDGSSVQSKTAPPTQPGRASASTLAGVNALAAQDAQRQLSSRSSTPFDLKPHQLRHLLDKLAFDVATGGQVLQQQTRTDELNEERRRHVRRFPTFPPEELQRQAAGGACISSLASARTVFENTKVAMGYDIAETKPFSYFTSWYFEEATDAQRALAAPVVGAQMKFGDDCLSRDVPKELSEPELKRAVGVLFFGDDPLCTGLRVDEQRVLTAKHCFLWASGPAAGKALPHTLSVKQGRGSLWFGYEAEPSKRFEVCRQSLPSDFNGELSPDIDNVLINIARTSAPAPSIKWADRAPMEGTPLYLRGYFAFAGDAEPLARMRGTRFCQATRETDPLATLRTDPLRGRRRSDGRGVPSSAGRSRPRERDDVGAAGGAEDAGAQGAWLGKQAHQP
jgi:hypothetical protein